MLVSAVFKVPVPKNYNNNLYPIGQAYVAVSHTKTRDSLTLTALNKMNE